jgi:hypothetical protein
MACGFMRGPSLYVFPLLNQDTAGCSMTEVAAMLGDTVAIAEKHYADLASKRMEDRLAKLQARTWN